MYKWISKANKKPEKFCRCLVYGPLLGMDVAHYNNNSNEFYCRTFNVTEYVTHWSELPDKPLDECESIAARKKQTNADRIRGMTDEELAQVLHCQRTQWPYVVGNDNGVVPGVFPADEEGTCNHRRSHHSSGRFEGDEDD